jgi:hypothetical protein
VLESACPDPVRALFVFLYLLKSNPEGVPGAYEPGCRRADRWGWGLWSGAWGLRVVSELHMILPHVWEKRQEANRPGGR